MTQRINTLLQDIFGTETDYSEEASILQAFLSTNSIKPIDHQIDGIQYIILATTGKMLTYQECLDLYNRI